MGEIFLARYGLAGFEKLAVIKKVLPHLAADEEFIARFVTEAQVAVKLQHANIAQVFEVGRVGDEYFLALEHIHGRDLRRTVSLLADSGRGMPPDLALFIAREVANALAYAHRRVDEHGDGLGLVHCDISPPNVMMSFDGEVKIIDFGIAKSALAAMDDDSKRGFGKFGYMAPEQLIRGREVEARTDIYALGTVLFEMLTGARLYEIGESPDYRALAKMVAKGQHPLPSDHDSNLAPFDELVRRALRPNVDDRYKTAAEFRDAIQRQLVELNPTISTDELAAFMCFMFAEDVLRQAEEIDRLDKTQISQWESELTKEAQQTVSFALAGALDMTSSASFEFGLVGEESASGVSKAAAVAGEVDSAAETDHTAIVGRQEEEIAETTRRYFPWALAAAALLLGLGGAYAWVQRDTSDSSPPAVATSVAQPRPFDASIPNVATRPPEAKADQAVEEPVALPVPASKAKVGSSERGKPAKVTEPDEPPKSVGDRPDATIIADAKAGFRKANREYSKFRSKHGGQLQSEWTTLLQYVTFAQNDSQKSRALLKKIKQFRAKMRKIERDTL